MRTLVQTLQDHDPGYLRAVAELWGIELTPAAAAEELAAAMQAQLGELALPEPARNVLEILQRSGGRLSWEQLQRQYGPLREMGAGKRDRTKPWRQPASALEMLWYRGLVGRSFGDSRSGPMEFGFIPRDLLEHLPPVEPGSAGIPGGPVAAPRGFTAASSQAIDDATTLLAALRRGRDHERPEQLERFLLQPASSALLRTLVGDLPQQPDQLKRFLTESRGAALAWLQRGWRISKTWNDLAQVGELQATGDEWPNDPVGSRAAALDLLASIPPGQWWSLSQTIADIQQGHPNFLRGPGGFESWYLQRASDGEFLSGFAHWEAVEGAYLRFLVVGPMHWLGGLDLSHDRQSFRVTPAAAALFGGEAEPAVEHPPGTAAVDSDGTIRIARSADRSLRYQVARFAEWEKADRGGYRYRLSAAALQQAEGQGLTAQHAASVLAQASAAELPAGPVRALERWATHGAEAVLLREMVLEVEDPQILERLANHRSTQRWIVTRLDPQRAVVREADWPKLATAALSLGLLIREPEP